MKPENMTREELIEFVKHHTVLVAKDFESTGLGGVARFSKGHRYYFTQDDDGVFIVDDEGVMFFSSYGDIDFLEKET
tara:strand:- start:93 stop:323 length:231 start_codon:yes stop_codon:yes gene_type:complete